MQFRRSWNRHDPGFLGENPGNRDLSRRRVLALRDCLQQFHQRPVRLPSLRREARHAVAEVRALKSGILVDLSGEITLAKWTERNEADSELFERWKDVLFRLPPPDGVFALKRRHRLHRMRAADNLHACF